MQIKIKKVRSINDIAGLIDELDFEMLKLIGKKTSIKKLRKRKKKIPKSKNLIVYLVLYNDIPAGFCSANIYEDYRGKKASIEDMYVKKQYRERGIGTKILQKMLNELHKRKVYFVFAFTPSTNIDGIKLYKFNGFKDLKSVVFYRQI